MIDSDVFMLVAIRVLHLLNYCVLKLPRVRQTTTFRVGDYMWNAHPSDVDDQPVWSFAAAAYRQARLERVRMVLSNWQFV